MGEGEILIHFDMDLYNAYGESYEIVSSEDLDMLFKFIGKELELGEISGKHSDVYRILERDSFDLLTHDPEKIEIWQDLVGCNIGAFSIIETIREQLKNEKFEEDDNDDE